MLRCPDRSVPSAGFQIVIANPLPARSPWFLSLDRAQRALAILRRRYPNAWLFADQLFPTYCVILD